MFPSNYVAAVEFGGKDVSLTISKVEIEALKKTDGTTEKKPVLHFSETPKKLVLNKTNANTIAELHGSEARKWAGKRITLFPDRCMSFGKQTDCVRVRSKIPAGGGGRPAPAATQQAPAAEDDLSIDPNSIPEPGSNDGETTAYFDSEGNLY